MWFADINYDYAAFSVPAGQSGIVFFSVTALGSGDIQVRTVEQPLGTGVNYSVTDVALGLAYGRQITDRFSAGLQANYITEKIWNTSSKALTFNLGTIYRLSDRGALVWASACRTWARRVDSPGATWASSTMPIPTPTATTAPCRPSSPRTLPPARAVPAGDLSVPYVVSENSSFLFLVEGLHPNDNSESLNLGAEWKLQQLLSLRMGYQTLFQTDSELGLTFGFGVVGDLGDNRYQVNYAWAGHEYLESTHRLTMVIEFLTRRDDMRKFCNMKRWTSPRPFLKSDPGGRVLMLDRCLAVVPASAAAGRGRPTPSPPRNP